MRVSARLWRKLRISWSMEMPPAQPAGIDLPPPWMLPGRSSVPVSRQLIPRIWPSPSPRTRLEMPRTVRRRSRCGARGSRIRLSPKSVPGRSGQNSVGIVPLGEKTMTSRWRGRAGAARPRLGRPWIRGSNAAGRPARRRNERRRMGVIGRRGAGVPGRGGRRASRYSPSVDGDRGRRRPRNRAGSPGRPGRGQSRAASRGDGRAAR